MIASPRRSGFSPTTTAAVPQGFPSVIGLKADLRLRQENK
jgi:hypothetical protein